ncbi:MAG: glycerol-3-phosphate 1-O-acyltransferase PlsY [Burkholderiaceae bacterium]|jgi:acyl phosphate:glycerol-3-phosphate acyltransferase|nr:glycerol-3-phosphate 1-O-acyltransferase PlsY [Burkholderiaceae bacterium]
METLAVMAALLAGYLLGSVSFAVIVSRLFGLADPRSYGSGNPGATNVLRSGSKAAALTTLLGDALKGVLAVYLVRWFGPSFGLGDATAAWAGAAAFIGHLYPVFFHFKGGKGVATFLGVMLAINLWLGLAACLIWGLVAFFFRYSSAASIAAAAAAPFVFAFVWGFDAVLAAVILMCLLLVFRHQQNIANLLAGKERKLGAKAPPAAH